MKKTLILLTIAATFLLLYGCGGGGGSSPTADTGGSSGGIGDIGTGGGTTTANLGTFTFYVPDEVTNNALIDLDAVSNGVRTAVRKYETTYPNIITTVCSDEVDQFCDDSSLTPTADDPRCNVACTSTTDTNPADGIPDGCFENPEYTAPQTSVTNYSWLVPEFCDVNDPPSSTNWDCTECTGPEVEGVCEANPFYRPQFQTNTDCTALETPFLCCTGSGTGTCTGETNPEAGSQTILTGDPPVCVNVDTGVEDTTRPSRILTYKNVKDTMLNSTGGGSVTVNIPASVESLDCTDVDIPYTCCTGAGTGTCEADDVYVFDAVRYVAGDLLWATYDSVTQSWIADAPETHCNFIGQIFDDNGTTNAVCTAASDPYTCCAGVGSGTCNLDDVQCVFFPLIVGDPGVDLNAIVTADLHLGRDYWQGQDTQGTQDTADDIPDLYVLSGDNTDLAAVPGAPVVLSLPSEIYSGLDYQVGNNRFMGDILRDNWYVRTREATDAEAADTNTWVFVSDSADRGTTAGIGALTLTAPETADAADIWVYHFGNFFFNPDMLNSNETYRDWLYVTNDSDILVPMGSVPVLP